MSTPVKIPHTPTFRLDGKKALVAGASSGIGLGCAVALAQAGADVLLAARRADKLQEITNAMTAEGLHAKAVQLDISDVTQTARYIDANQPFDILVNSAGIARHGKALETSLQDFDEVMATNLRAAFFLCSAVAAKMISSRKQGSIITISSQMAHVGGVERSVYCASKHGVEGFTKAMAIEWGKHNIRINTICPTFIRTDLTETTFQQADKLRWIENKIQLGRIGQIEDIMGAIVFLASQASALITGSSLMVDGGWTIE